MSHQANTLLLERAVELADEMDARFEDPTYIDLVAELIHQSDLERLWEVMGRMEFSIKQANVGDLPETTIW